MKGFVYRIYDNTNGNVYYGSTIQSVSNRITKHRSKYKEWLKGDKRVYCRSFDIIKNGDYSYNIVEEVEFEIKYELYNRERYYIENNECVNKCIPNRTVKEWYEENKDKAKEYYENNKDKIKEYQKNNKDKIKEYQKNNKDKIKEYRENNKDKIKEYQKEYRENNKDKRKEYYENNKDKAKEYYENNKDKVKKYRENNKDSIKDKRKKYYENNKDNINEKVTCECGCIVCKRCLSRHKKTKKHLKLIS